MYLLTERYNMTKEIKDRSINPLIRIAETLEEILRLVKLDQEKMEKARLREPDDIKGDW